MNSETQTGQWTINGPSVKDTLNETAGALIAVTVGNGYYTTDTQTTHIGYVIHIDSTSFDLNTAQGVMNISFLEVEIIELAD